MNAESTAFRASRAAVPGPGGEGARAAAWLLSWPMRLAATPLGRRLLAALLLGVVLVSGVSYLYDSPDPATASAAMGSVGLAVQAPAWWAARQKVAIDRVRSLQQRRVSANETQVLVVAEGPGSMPSRFVT